MIMSALALLLDALALLLAVLGPVVAYAVAALIAREVVGPIRTPRDADRTVWTVLTVWLALVGALVCVLLVLS